MSISHLERAYRCLDDCRQDGCPGHVASVVYQSTSESFVFRDGRGQEFYIQTPEVAAFCSMLAEFATYRAEIRAIVRA